MERNIDKIKRLEYELERYRQKVDRQEAELAQLRPNAKTALDGLAAAHATMNASTPTKILSVPLSFIVRYT